MPAGKIKTEKIPDPPIEEAPEVDTDLTQDTEFPAVGEAVTYVEWDMERARYFEFAGLVTGIQPPHTTVSLVVFFPHARAGRVMSDVPVQPVDFVDNPVTHWRYPEVSEEFHQIDE